MPDDHSVRQPVSWVAQLLHNDDGVPFPTVSNAMLIFAHDPVLKGILGYDAFKNDPLIMRPAPPIDEGSPTLPGPYPRLWEAADITLINGYMQRLWNHRFGRDVIENAMISSAHLSEFHPVRNYLKSLKWDRLPRIDMWLSAAFDVEMTPLTRAIAAKFLIAAVRRVMQPGCKFDHMMILEGPQGIGKSRALQLLCGAAWFSDCVPMDLNGKDAAMALNGVWITEFAEIEHIIRVEIETLKAFLSRAVDRYRPPYARGFVERPRQGITVGTTNARDYLRDTTGNRRIWPIKCRTADPEWVALNRDQLWAEAVVREATGEAIWLDDETIENLAKEEAEKRMAGDVWEDKIRLALIGRQEITTAEILESMNVQTAHMTKSMEMRVANVLRHFGWERHVSKGTGGKSKRIWRVTTFP